MRAVQDLLFLESLSFRLHMQEAVQAKSATFSMGEAAEKACALIGIELIDFDTVMWHPVGNYVRVDLYAKSWRERWGRIAAQVAG